MSEHQERLAARLGYLSYRDMVAASVDLSPHEGDARWYVTPTADGQWAAWDTASFDGWGVETFPTYDDAVRCQIDGAVADYEAHYDVPTTERVEVVRNFDGNRVVGFLLSCRGAGDERFGAF